MISITSKDNTNSNDYDNNDGTDNSDASSYYIPTYENELIDLPLPPSLSPCVSSNNNENKYQRHQFEVLTVVPPPLEYMMSLHSEEREISGRQVWCGSFMLAAFLLWKEQRQENDCGVDGVSEDVIGDNSGGGSVICGRRVLELGSGTGILGMLASRLQPTLVAITDGDSTAIDNLRRNLSNPTNEIDASVAKVCPLSWGNAADDRERILDVEEDVLKETMTEDGGDYGGGWREFHSWCRTSWPDVYHSVHDDDGTMEEMTNSGSGTTSFEMKRESSQDKETEVKEKEEGDDIDGVGISNSDVVFDCILAGDVIYKPNLPKIFFQTVVQHLAPSPSPHTADKTRNNQRTPSTQSSLYLCHVPRAGITHPIVRTAAHDAGLDIVKEWDVGDLGGEEALFGRKDDGEGEEVDTEEAVVELDDVRRARVYCMRLKSEQ